MGIKIGKLKIPLPGDKGGNIPNPIDGAKKAVDAVKREAEDAVRKVQREAQDAVRDVGREVSDGLIKQVEHEVEKVAKSAFDTIPDEVEKALEKALEEFFKLLSRGALDKWLSVMDVALPDAVWPQIGPVGMAISDVRAKMKNIRHWARNPPHDKNTLKQMVSDIGPDDVKITIKVNVPGTDSLSAGGTLVYKTPNFLDRADTLWGAIKP